MEKRMFGATDGIRAKVGTWPLRPAALRRLGEAAAEYFDKEARIWLGRDTRESGVWMRDAFCVGAAEGGLRVVDAGVLPTPAISKIVGADKEAAGGIMLTASHNPATDNGVKLFRSDGEKLSDEEELAFEKIYFAVAEEGDIDPPEVTAEMDYAAEALRAYVGELRRFLGDLRYDGEVLYDAAAGAGQSFDQAAMAEFGLHTRILSPTPDGKNINDGCGALHPEKLAAATKEQGCWGVAMDGDADRVLLADEEGRIWDGDRTIALLAVALAEKGDLPKKGVVVTEYSNLAALQYLEAQGVQVEKVVNGDRFVAQKCADRGYALGGEASGHIIYLPWLGSSDGCFVTLMVAKLVQERGGRLADLWPDYRAMPSKQWALAVREKRELMDIAGWNEALAAVETKLHGQGRVFCRYSGTEAKLRIMVEATDEGLLEECGEKLAKIIRKEIGDD